MDEIELLRRKIEREKKARYSAEFIAEKCSRELYLKNQELDQVAKRIASFLPYQLLPLINNTQHKLNNLTARCYITACFVDVSGFSAMTEDLEPEAVVSMLNDYFDKVIDCAEQESGLVDKFIGDGALVFFGSPVSKGREEDARAALRFAIKMQKAFKILCHEWRRFGVDHNLGLRIGVNSGHCTVGNFGSERRFQFTALGSALNLASRMEKMAKPGQILCTFSTSALTGGEFQISPLGERSVKGIPKLIPVFEVQDSEAQHEVSTKLAVFLKDLSDSHVDSATLETVARIAIRHFP